MKLQRTGKTIGKILLPFRIGAQLILFIFKTIVIGIVVMMLIALWFQTPRDESYRDLYNGVVGGCDLGDRLAKWNNDERAATVDTTNGADNLQCALQRHAIPAHCPGNQDLAYYVGFLEFKENGNPYRLRTSAQSTIALGSDGVRTQLDLLKAHLLAQKDQRKTNYVIVFVHGWRNDSRIGNANVADLRHYAAHFARFLAKRCEERELVDGNVDKNRYCNATVTAIYVGWRGARVDEERVAELFGKGVASALAVPTLFDRKPVSEAIAPSVISALRALEFSLGLRTSKIDEKQILATHHDKRHSRMIVFGHSLGGNLLITGLQDHLIKSVRQHKPGERLPPVLGDLVVLINPAAEAAKWTEIQREVWSQIASEPDSTTPDTEVKAAHEFFPVDQPPVLASFTAALHFPMGGLRESDCIWINEASDCHFEDEKETWYCKLEPETREGLREKLRDRLQKSEGMMLAGGDVDYDFATYDIFPAFKLDFRPLAERLERLAAKKAGQPIPHHSCPIDQQSTFNVGPWSKVASKLLSALAWCARTFPFQATDREQTRTIGHLDPPRPADGILLDARKSMAPFGSTHELAGLNSRTTEPVVKYAEIADATWVDCPSADYWLIRARLGKCPYGSQWDSEASPEPDSLGGDIPAHGPKMQFVHGYIKGGTLPITQANDPFWNLRAFDNALARHDGYKLSSFICGISQLVIDDVTRIPAAMKSHCPKSAAGGDRERHARSQSWNPRCCPRNDGPPPVTQSTTE